MVYADVLTSTAVRSSKLEYVQNKIIKDFSEMKTNGYLKWNSINWREIRIRVWRVQTKIYSCSSRNESNEVIKLQKMLINLIEAKLLAVRKVTQDNRGKATL